MCHPNYKESAEYCWYCHNLLHNEKTQKYGKYWHSECLNHFQEIREFCEDNPQEYVDKPRQQLVTTKIYDYIN